MTYYATMFPDESQVRPKPVCTYDDEPGSITRKPRHTDALFDCPDRALVRTFYRRAAEEDLLESLGGGHEKVHMENETAWLRPIYGTELWHVGAQS